MNISIICSNKKHPVFPWLEKWKQQYEDHHEVEIVQKTEQLSGGDLLFLISCHEIINADIRGKYKYSLVIHASDLPQGRGWSPHIWEILQGNNKIVVSLLEVADKVDSGAVWKKQCIDLEGHELLGEINNKLFDVETNLMDFALENCGQIDAKDQDDSGATYFRKRTPEDSKIEVDKTIAEQFDLLRVTDPENFPAFIEYRGHRYNIKLIKVTPGDMEDLKNEE